MDAAVERAAVELLDGRVQGDEVRGELVGLRDAVAGERGVGGDAGGGGDVGVVGAGFGVDDPVGAELWCC